MPKYPKHSFVYLKDGRCGYYVDHNKTSVLVRMGITPNSQVWYWHKDVYQVFDFDLPINEHTVYLDPSEGVPFINGTMNVDLAENLKPIGC